MKAVILGVTGYTGAVLYRILNNHNQISRIIPVSSTRAGLSLQSVDPGLSDYDLLKTKDQRGLLVSVEEALQEKADVVFAALPHLKSAEILRPFAKDSVIIDLSADFRIKDPVLFKKAYGAEMPAPDLMPKAVYGLTEWFRKEIETADIIANPGCYPTASLLPLLPLVKEGLLKGPYTINALSGISGAGRKAKINNLFVERSENTTAYAPGKSHRHFTEIAEELTFAGEKEAFSEMLFTPHLVPLIRGMAVTTTAQLTRLCSKEDIHKVYQTYYKNCPFIGINTERCPETADVRTSNRCDISCHIEDQRIILMSAQDNLVKGASGQAVQNMNVRFRLKETEGLRISGEL